MPTNKINRSNYPYQKTEKEFDDNKQIYQFPYNSSPQLIDLIPQSDESNSHETVQSKWSDILSLFVNNIGINNTYLPVFTQVQGISNVVVNNPHYDAIRTNSGAVINVEIEMDVTVNSSGLLAQLKITNPITSGFTNVGQAQLLNFQIVPTANVGVSGGNTGCGWFNQFYSDASTGSVFLGFETAQTSTQYHVTLAWKYEIQ